jgi:hypothetical protein
MDAAWLDAPKNIRENGQDIVTAALQILLSQFKLPYPKRDHGLIMHQWKIVNSEGRKTGLFKGIEVSPDCKTEFQRFLNNNVH